MTSEGSATARFERAIATGRPHIVVPAALDLPRPILLRDGLRVLLVLLDHKPEDFQAAAVRWASSFVNQRNVSAADAALASAALEAMASDRPVAGGTALEALLEQYGEHQAAAYLGQWVQLRDR